MFKINLITLLSYCGAGLFVHTAASEEKNISAKSGQKEVTLPCQAAYNNTLGVQWRRLDLEPEYVLFYRGRYAQPQKQHSLFVNRTDLLDQEMKDGNLSLILRNVVVNDTGKYECRVFRGKPRSWTSISNVTLSVVVPPAQSKIITAESGQNVNLTCRAQNDNIGVIVWSRADLEPERIFVFQNKRFDPENQHQSFKGRVALQDEEMKDGDGSLVLKDVTTADNGTYKCCIVTAGSTSCDPISIIYLSVVDPPGLLEVYVVLGLLIAFLLAVTGFLINRELRYRGSYKPLDSKAPLTMVICGRNSAEAQNDSC